MYRYTSGAVIGGGHNPPPRLLVSRSPGTPPPAPRGQLTVWSLKLFKPLHQLPLGPAAAAVHALAFNHNGKMLATAGADGMIRLYDLNAQKQIMGRVTTVAIEPHFTVSLCTDSSWVLITCAHSDCTLMHP